MGIPLYSASTMSLPEGASHEGRLLGHPSRLDPAFLPGLPPQTESHLHSGFPSSDWASSFRLDSTLIPGLCPPTGPPPSAGPLPSDQVSPESKITVTDMYKDIPTKASCREGSTPFRRTFRLSLASPVPSLIWGEERSLREGEGRGWGRGEAGGGARLGEG